MTRFADLDKPPFFTALYAAPGENTDAGQFSEAVATMVSTAMLLSGFVGFSEDTAEGNRPVKLVYWKTYHAMQIWRKTARDLLPHAVSLEDCIASEGCHWQWHDPVKTHNQRTLRQVA